MLELLMAGGPANKSVTITANNYSPDQGSVVVFTVAVNGISSTERVYWALTAGSALTGATKTSGSAYPSGGKITFGITIPYNTANNLKSFTVGVGLTIEQASSSTEALAITSPITVQKMVEQVGQLLRSGTSVWEQWVVPSRTTNISVVCVGPGAGGGGGLGYRKAIKVTPGETLTISIGVSDARLSRGSTVLCMGESASGETGGFGGRLADAANDGGGNGGDRVALTTNGNHVRCGGGAGGYSGNGGTCSEVTTGTAGAGGGGGSGYSNASTTILYQGGGTGVLGAGTDGAPGQAGSGGSGRQYGGGHTTTDYSSVMSDGAVRIIWGPGRAYPSTGTADQPTVN